MNKITCFQGKTVFLQKTKTQNTKKGWRPTAPKHTCRVLFVVPLVSSRSRIVFVYLVHCKSVTHLVFFFSFGVLFFFFLVVVFRLVFPYHRISEMFILIFCCRACILAFSPGPAKNPYSDQRTTPQNGIWFIFVVLNNVLKYLFLQCFVNINQNFPQSKWALKKTI